MRWTRRRPKVEYVYHASPECVLEDIQIWGIRDWGTGIYLSETPEDALRLSRWKLVDHQHQDGVVHHDEIIVWKVAVSELQTGRWSVGTDHNPDIFKDVTSWLYSDDIPRHAILGATAYTQSG